MESKKRNIYIIGGVLFAVLFAAIAVPFVEDYTYKQKRKKRAMESYSNALARKLNDPNPYETIGKYNIALGLGLEEPFNYFAYEGIADTYYLLASYSEAIRYYKEALELNISENCLGKSDRSYTYYKLGEIYIINDEPIEAIQALKKSLELSPNRSSVYSYLGIAYANLGQKEKAIENCKLGQQKSPDDYSSYKDMGWVYAHFKEHSKALEEYQKAKSILSSKTTNSINKEYNLENLSEIEYNIGISYHNLNLTEQAVKAYKMAIQYNENNPSPYNALGLIYLYRGDKELAMEMYRILSGKENFLMKKLVFYAAAAAILSIGCVSEHTGQRQVACFEVQSFENVRIPMADRVELSANISRPKAEGRFPVILVRTPYGKGNAEDDDGRYHARRGYAFIIQDCRGTGDSAGAWEPGVNERADGLDTHQWILEQDWCDGKIATSGGSYLGFTQWVVAPDTGDWHKAMFTLVPLMDWYKGLAYIGGAFGLGTNMGWGSEMLKPTEGEGAGLPDDWDIDKAYRYLPLSRWDETIGFKVQFMRDWVAHPQFDSYWVRTSIAGKADQVKVPNITLSGWYDIFVSQAFEYVKAVRQTAQSDIARKHCHLIVGPWAHGPNWMAGERNFGKNAGIDVEKLRDRWFAHWLKGTGPGIDDLPPYRIFVMGRNEWRDEYEWPLVQTQYTPYYFHSLGSANSLKGDGTINTAKPADEPADTFVYDPEKPVPTRGGCILFGDEFGAQNQAETEKRNDVLVFTSKELREELEVTGQVVVILYAASNAPDTDWTAKLVDVYPDGRAFNLCDGIIRARWRDSLTEPALIEPGRIYRYEIDLWVTSNVFLPGHRIRVEISSSNFPRLDRNPNTGHKFGADAKLRKATQTIYHDADHPSHIILPVIPNRSEER